MIGGAFPGTLTADSSRRCPDLALMRNAVAAVPPLALLQTASDANSTAPSSPTETIAREIGRLLRTAAVIDGGPR